MLRPEEVESLVCGLPTLNLTELQKVVTYDGYSKDDPIIKLVLLIIIVNLHLSCIYKFYTLFEKSSIIYYHYYINCTVNLIMIIIILNIYYYSFC